MHATSINNCFIPPTATGPTYGLLRDAHYANKKLNTSNITIRANVVSLQSYSAIAQASVARVFNTGTAIFSSDIGGLIINAQVTRSCARFVCALSNKILL